MTVNIKKTQIVNFSGGRKGRNDIFFYGKNEVQVVNSYCYLGINVTSRLSFTNHVLNVKKKAMLVVSTLTNLGKVSIKTAIKIFNMRIKPIVIYSLSSFSRFLTLNNILKLDRIKSLYLKKTLLLPKHTTVTLVHELCSQRRLIEGLIHDGLVDLKRKVRRDYLSFVEEKAMEFVVANYTDGPAFQTHLWKESISLRYQVVGFTAHGFHHLWCENKAFHSHKNNCICRFCRAPNTERLHGLTCTKVIGKSLIERHSFILNN